MKEMWLKQIQNLNLSEIYVLYYDLNLLIFRKPVLYIHSTESFTYNMFCQPYIIAIFDRKNCE